MHSFSKLVPSLRFSSKSSSIYHLKSIQVVNFSASASRHKAESSTTGPLSGIRILDMSRVLGIPKNFVFNIDILKNIAEVIKIEHPKMGDDTRAWGPPYAPYKVDITKSENPKNKIQPHRYKGESAYYLCVNRNKKSVTINIKEKKGQEIIKELAKNCDVFIENYVPGKLAEMGLGYEDLKKVNDKLIYASVTGYGTTGPYSNKPGYDVMIEAEAGLMHITGEKDRSPVKVGVAITDITTGLYAHGSIIASLLKRLGSNKGQHLDISLMNSQLSTLANIGSGYLIGGLEASRWGAEHISVVPYRNFKTKTDPICIGCGNDKQFKILVKSLGLEWMASDPRFISNTSRIHHRELVDETIQDRLSLMTRDEILKIMDNKGVPVTPINNMAQTFSHPQVIAKKLVKEIDHPAVGNIKIVGPAVGYSETPLKVFNPPPMLGQHTKEVLGSILGYTEENMDTLSSEGIISTFDYKF
ncbi:hypothetical protein BB559_001305 [Furculomyces boomerangus]|uniref:Uncharacterized protein n=1 Tax=Furculomyces boomerangus TaxID=61424 RepID=A0A2T9Z2J6_9FUNG|nr:hypothetical protein BB559_001305 [Furculomyces boomerangus]